MGRVEREGIVKALSGDIKNSPPLRAKFVRWKFADVRKWVEGHFEEPRTDIKLITAEVVVQVLAGR